MQHANIILMEESSILLPVKCPKCGSESLSEFPVIVVMMALTRWNHMALHASCHEGSWDASVAEIRQIRQYLGNDWIQTHQLSVRTGKHRSWT